MKTKQLIEGRLTVIKALMNDHKFDIEELKKERKQLKKQLEELLKLEVKQWYKYRTCLFCYNGIDDSDGYPTGYGFSDDKWLDNDPKDGWGNRSLLVKATPKEVLTALSKEAVKREFKEGVRIENYMGSFTLDATGSIFVFPDGDLVYGTQPKCFTIMKDGKWAKIIKENTVHLDGDYNSAQLKDALIILENGK